MKPYRYKRYQMNFETNLNEAGGRDIAFTPTKEIESTKSDNKDTERKLFFQKLKVKLLDFF